MRKLKLTPEQVNTSLVSQANSKISRLHDRAAMLKAARHFFDQRSVTEVDCPSLSRLAAIETHLDLITASYRGKETCYLHSSPEMGMKRLLAEGIGDIYQLSHVFRDGEWSHKHNPEFTMVEWYRLGMTLEQLIEETVQFSRLFLGDLPYRTVSYRKIFLQQTGIDYVVATEKELFDYIKDKQIPYYPSILDEGKDALLNLILGSEIEPKLGWNEFFVLVDYPASQASLACKRIIENEEVAERFEIYYQGVELANGFHELTHAQEQRLRFKEANAARVALGKSALPPDENFLNALEKGLPDCCGVAVGFDRLMMLRQNTNQISDVLAWGWSEA